jgi:hypothetical protein
VNFNSEIFTISSNISDANLLIISAMMMKSVADAYNGSAGGSSWTAPFYMGKGRFSLSPEDLNGNPVAGIGVTSSPSGPTILYNIGADNYLTVGPTAPGSANTPEVGGYSNSAGIYAFTLTKYPTAYRVSLPLILGEFSGSFLIW